MKLLTKRRKFVLSAILLSLGLYLLEAIDFEWKYQAITVHSLLAGILTFWSLREAATGLSSVMTCILPIFFTAGVSLFYFLLPSSLLTIIPVILVYLVGMYALLLTENIFSVAAIRTINLFRSASAVGFFLTLLTSFFLFNAFLSLKLPFYYNFLAVILISFPITLAGLWTVKLEEKLNRDLIFSSLLFSLFLAEISLVISFWPVTVTVGSLFLTTCLYVFLGLGQAYFNERLFQKTILEYLSVALIVFLTLIIYTPWG